MTDQRSSMRAPRRALVKAGAALATGLALGGAYARPSLSSVELVEVAYASGNPIGPGKGGWPDDGNAQ